jgi:nucleotide-binding universal stress UspA family protein
MQLARILLTTDLSEESLRAFRPLAALASAQGSQITLLNVVEDVPVIPHGAPFAPPISSPGLEEEQDAAREWLDQHRHALGHGIECDVQVIRARKVGEAVAEYAREFGFDLIAMSTHGRTGFRHLVLGSVTESVLRHADRPVLVFPRSE